MKISFLPGDGCNTGEAADMEMVFDNRQAIFDMVGVYPLESAQKFCISVPKMTPIISVILKFVT